MSADPLYGQVIGQAAAIATLRAAAGRPVHAYLFVGPPGTGKRAAAAGFAASLLCPDGGDGTCETCLRVLAGTHPDVVLVEREGAQISIDQAREISRLAARSPLEGARKVLILTDFHLVRDAGPALLKTIEEPPESAIFVVLADHVTPELVTIASRCVRVEFAALPEVEIRDQLVREGVDPGRAAELARLSGGRLDRVRLLAGDPEAVARRRAWQAVPARLDGNGATAAALADELVGLLEHSVGPLQTVQARQVAALEERNARALEVNGKLRNRAGLKSGLKELEERHRRELRRQRTDELRAGLAVLAGEYRDRAAQAGADAAVVERSLAAVQLIQKTAETLAFNPGELLLIQALLVRLGRLGLKGAARAGV